MILKGVQQQIFLDQLDYFPEGFEEGKEISHEESRAALNAAKLRYCFSLSVTGTPSDLEKFAVKALHLYRASLKLAQPSLEAVLLTSMALIRRAHLGKTSSSGDITSCQDASYLIRATLVLEACLRRTKEYYPHTLVLLRTEAVLGMM